MGKIGQSTTMPVDDLIPYANNARVHDGAQVDLIARSIEEFWFLNPILIDKDKNVIAGHGRILAAKKNGLERVPVLFVEGLTEEQKRAYIIADNRLTELGGWNMDIVNDELEQLQFGGFDVSVTGFDFEIDPIEPEAKDDEFDPDKEPPVMVSRGEIWRLGDHTLMCGDSTEMNAVAMLMEGEKADMVFTDPPWNVSYGESKNERWKQRQILNDSMTTDEFKEFMRLAFTSMNYASKDGAMIYVVMSAQEWGNMMLTLKETGHHWSSTIIWNKDRLVLSRKDYHTKYEPIWYGWKEGEARLCPLEDRKQCDVWDFERPIRSDEHPTMKPIPLVARAITNSSHKGNIILDLFGGSGTTLIACEETGRKCRMMELDPHYCDVIIDRWEQFTGGKAECLKK